MSSSNDWNKRNRSKMNKVAKRYYNKNKEDISEKVKRFREENIEFVRSRERKYSKKKRKKASYKSYQTDYQKKWKKTDVGRRKSMKDTARRLKKKKQLKETFTIKEWDEKVENTRGICPKCNKFVGCDKLTIDHVLPISLAPEGFEYTIDDVSPLCKPCNSRKSNKYDWRKGDVHHIGVLVDEFEKYIKLFESFGGKVMYKGTAEKFEAECIFIDMGNMFVELIKSTNKDNGLSRYLKKRGPCLHHVAFMGKGKHKGALPKMLVDFKLKQGILIEEVEFDE